jgi:RNA polymerase sigma-70 factor (ECF subfamily)
MERDQRVRSKVATNETRTPCILDGDMMADPQLEIINRLIVLQCRQGRQEGFELLVQTWQRPLFYYIMRLVEREEEAWDAIQDTWLRVFGGIRSVRSAEALPAWLYQVAHNVVMSRWRKQCRDKAAVEDVDDTAMAELEDTQPLQSDMSASSVHDALAKLPVAERAALTLHFLEGYKVHEIAQITGEPVGTVKSRMFRAKQNLRTILEREESQT